MPKFTLSLNNEEYDALMETVRAKNMPRNTLIREFIRRGLENLDGKGELSEEASNYINLMIAKGKGRKVGEYIYSFRKAAKWLDELDKAVETGEISEESAEEVRNLVRESFREGRGALRNLLRKGTTEKVSPERTTSSSVKTRNQQKIDKLIAKEESHRAKSWPSRERNVAMFWFKCDCSPFVWSDRAPTLDTKRLESKCPQCGKTDYSTKKEVKSIEWWNFIEFAKNMNKEYKGREIPKEVLAEYERLQELAYSKKW